MFAKSGCICELERRHGLRERASTTQRDEAPGASALNTELGAGHFQRKSQNTRKGTRKGLKREMHRLSEKPNVLTAGMSRKGGGVIGQNSGDLKRTGNLNTKKAPGR